VFGVDKLRKIAKAFIVSLVSGCLILSLSSCGGDRVAGTGDRLHAATPADSRGVSSTQLVGNISEVSPPEVIQQLRSALEVYQPQVKILSPQADEVFQDDTVTVRFQVQDLPIFKNKELDMGPHLHVILDNQPYIAVYDLNQPVVFPDLAPGTHTLRVFASRPWHESFKNEGAYAQTTFHIFTKTDDNNPDPAQPLLTYSRPKGSYGAEPILLDFYLTNAPLHLVAQENPQDEIADWRIRCTINGSSFVLDRWEAIYLKGFKPGKNWVQLEFLDEQGNPVKNVFNNSVRVITYEAKGKDTLSKLVRGELSAAAARGIVDPNYTATVPEATPTPTSTATPSPTPTPEPVPLPSLEEIPPETEPSEEKPVETENKDLTETTKEESKIPETQKPKGFFNRFQRPSTTKPSPALPDVMETPAPESITPDVAVPQPEAALEPQPLATPQEKPTPEETETLAKPDAQNFKLPVKQRFGGYFNRFRRPETTPSPNMPPTLPELMEPNETAPQPETSAEPNLVPALEPIQPPE
jgi:hypothetical protein